MNTITRKIQLIIDEPDVKGVYEKLYRWNEIVFRGYNYVSTHLYIQENLKEFFYMNDDFKLTLTNKVSEEVPNPPLKTSRQNTTYQLLSDKFKGDIPTSILTCLNQSVKLMFSSERKDYFAGKKSLRSYKRNVPIPIEVKGITKTAKISDNNKDYEFKLYGIKFRTNFGRDNSGNQTIFERGLSNSYKFCNSSIQLDKNKIFLLATFQFESEERKLDYDKKAKIELSLKYPVILTYKRKRVFIGSRDEFLYRRLKIKYKLHKLQADLKYNNGGKGRTKKLQAIQKYKKLEHDYIKNKLHLYSREVINFCLKNEIGTLVLENQEEEMRSLEKKIAEVKSDESLSRKEKRELIENHKFVIQNWSYYGLMNLLKYKADIYGIKIVS